MNAKDRRIVDQLKRDRHLFENLEVEAVSIIKKAIVDSGILVHEMEHRIKREKSLAGKLAKRGEHIQDLYELTDILGTRIVCYFADDVDKMGKLIEDCFDVDRAHSTDKRTLLKANTFGYLSLHYIVSLKKDAGYPEELTKIRFEIQIRSILQHAWAVIEHDLGYKTEFGVPREVVRGFARLAGLLEIADDEFIRTRDRIVDYTEETRAKIIGDNAEDVDIDTISLREYMLRNKKMREFIGALSKLLDVEITEGDCDMYIPQIQWLHIDTIGGLQRALERNKDLALALAEKTLAGTDLDILSSSVALRFLCQAELLSSGFTEESALGFVRLSVKDEARASRQVKRLFNLYKELN